MQIKGLENMTTTEVNMELQKGAKFVMYQYCVSMVVITLKRSSDIYFIRADDATFFGPALGYSLISLTCGWWGIPWGPIYTISTLVTNIRGGKNVTQQVVASLNAPTT